MRESTPLKVKYWQVNRFVKDIFTTNTGQLEGAALRERGAEGGWKYCAATADSSHLYFFRGQRQVHLPLLILVQGLLPSFLELLLPLLQPPRPQPQLVPLQPPALLGVLLPLQPPPPLPQLQILHVLPCLEIRKPRQVAELLPPPLLCRLEEKGRYILLSSNRQNSNAFPEMRTIKIATFFTFEGWFLFLFNPLMGNDMLMSSQFCSDAKTFDSLPLHYSGLRTLTHEYSL